MQSLIKEVASRYGFRERDFSVAWDSIQRNPSEETIRCVITTSDGRQAVARMARDAVSRRDGWKCFSAIETAFVQLARRHELRGE